MVCLLAFLLYTGTELAQKDRFVITSFEDNEPSYQSYEVNYQKLFPVPDKDSGIHSTSVKINGPGTYLTVYCSIKVSIKDLQEFVSKDLTKAQVGLGRGFSNDQSAEDECFNHVVNLDRERTERAIKLGIQEIQAPEPDSFPVSWLIQSDQCTKRLLISLAYQRRILCANGFGLRTLYRDKDLPTIKFDEPMEIAATVLDSQMIMRKTVKMKEMALGWNQGKLQVFSREVGNHWKQEPSHFEEPSLGWIISEFVRKGNAQVRDFVNKFDTRYHHKEYASEWIGVRRTVSHGLETYREFRHSKLHVKLRKFSPTPADGYLDDVKLRKLFGIY
ncbi:unnamed protein product [Blumeria hordei]|uniref:Uncharacterized protein n=2 Tax=Blumeria hordei TaxID=2867405 RepID=A0A383V071_BLUHO|nr:CSEP0016 putative effector protein [Blumeria hordei DH14]SZF05406.1 unnamed protein product [Blumeria hordei]